MPRWSPVDRGQSWDDGLAISSATDDDGSRVERSWARLFGYDTANTTWRRISVDANGKLQLAANVSVDLGSVDQGTGGTSAWKVDGSGVTQPVSGTFWQATQPVSGAISVSNFPADQIVQGDVADGAADSGNPVKVAAVYHTTKPSYTDGLRGQLSMGQKGALRVELWGADDGSNKVSVATPADGLVNNAGGLRTASLGQLFNGTAWDRWYGNFGTTTGDTGTKIVSFAGATQTNFNARGAIITVLLGAVSGSSPTLACQLQSSPDGGTTWLNVGAAMTNLTTTNQTGAIWIYPTNMSTAGATPAALTTGATQTLMLNAPLARTWRVNYTIGGTSPSFAISSVQVNYIL